LPDTLATLKRSLRPRGRFETVSFTVSLTRKRASERSQLRDGFGSRLSVASFRMPRTRGEKDSFLSADGTRFIIPRNSVFYADLNHIPEK